MCCDRRFAKLEAPPPATGGAGGGGGGGDNTQGPVVGQFNINSDVTFVWEAEAAAEATSSSATLRVRRYNMRPRNDLWPH